MTHASGYYLAWPGRAASVSVSPNNNLQSFHHQFANIWLSCQMRALRDEVTMYLMGSINGLHTQFCRFSVHPKPQTFFVCFVSVFACNSPQLIKTVDYCVLPQRNSWPCGMPPLVPMLFSWSQPQFIWEGCDVLMFIGLWSLFIALAGGIKLTPEAPFCHLTVSLIFEKGLSLEIQERFAPINLEF